MVNKPREFPVRLKSDEALLRRLPLLHKKRDKIKLNLKKNWAGYRGELEVDYHLSFLPEDEYYIYQNLRLPIENRYFQIDTLILSAWISLIIETKNIYGHLFFDPVSRQLIRTFDHYKERFPDPILQARRQKLQLQRWLGQHFTKIPPIHYLVAIGNSNTLVETTKGNEHIYQSIFHAEHLPDEIIRLSTCLDKCISSYMLKKMDELLIQCHTLEAYSSLDHYQISAHELITGIACPRCSVQPMDRIHGKWKCPHCQTTSKNAHEQVIIDHLTLNNEITNEQCRKLLHISSHKTVTRILGSMNLSSQGNTKGQVYFLK